MIRSLAITSVLLATPAFAQDMASGDAEAGEGVFKQCAACHVVENEAGETLAGRNGKVGPNLYGIAMRTLGTYPEFRYSDALVELGEGGAVWDEENFVGYVQDPTGWLREELDNNRARGKMAYKLGSEEDARNVYAYLASLGPAEGEETKAAE
ncbi:c-type cytochrome [Roseovarius aquimarinus]|uniref:C-type cytochrome n=1 Tax=Roseovarius aquimarinus TaxID=1229156 RepID=A0ABW7I369_9RHOB